MNKKILVISKCPTHPTNAGNRWAILAQAEALIKLGADVHFLYVQELPMRKDINPYLEDYQETKKYWRGNFHCFSVKKIDKFRINVMSAIDKRFKNNYHTVDEDYPFGLTSYVKSLQAQYDFDICIVNYIWLSKLFNYVKFKKTAIHTHDAMAYKNLKVGKNCRSITANEEAKGLQRSENLFALQDEEAAYFSILSPRSKIYNIYSIYEYQPQPIVGNHNIVFLSGSNEYNQNGIRWFVYNIWPMVIELYKDARLFIGGSICKTINDLCSIKGVELQDHIDNPFDFYAQADVAINPICQGTGLKIKTFEALSYDKVTLVHPHSMAGIFKKDEAPLFASDKPEEWKKYLMYIWGDKSIIEKVKSCNSNYMNSMYEYIMNEYAQFLK